MKTESKTVISSVSKNEKLNETTNETLAKNLEADVEQGKARLLSVAEMWRLRKNFRSASNKRYLN